MKCIRRGQWNVFYQETTLMSLLAEFGTKLKITVYNCQQKFVLIWERICSRLSEGKILYLRRSCVKLNFGICQVNK